MPTILKSVLEEFPETVDFTPKMPPGDELSDGTVDATTSAGVIDNTVLDSTTVFVSSGNLATIGLQGGTLGERYSVVLTMNTLNGNVLESGFELVIVEDRDA